MADDTKAQIGQYTELAYSDDASPPQFTDLGAIRSIAGVGVARSEVDSTTLDSDAVERIGGMKDGKQITIVFTTRSVVMELLEDWLAAADAKRLRLTFPAPTSEVRYFDFVPLDYDLGTITPNGLQETTLMGRITGDISDTP